MVAPGSIVPAWFLLAILGVIIGAVALVVFIVELFRKKLK